MAGEASSNDVFAKHKKQKLQELESGFLRAVREMKFRQALRLAETILALEPNHIRVKEFVPVLQDKIALESADDDESEDEGEDEAADHADVESASNDDDDDDDEDEDSDDEDDEDEESEEDGAIQEHAVAASTATDRIGAYPPGRRRWLVDDQLSDLTLASSSQGGATSAQEDPDGHRQQHTPAGPGRIALDTSNSVMAHEQRRKLRAELAASIQELKAKEKEKEIMAGDPLLGA